MILYKQGNLLESEAQALVNTVNTVGVMGKGIALQFKNAYPRNYKLYVAACKNCQLVIGQLLIIEEDSLLKGKKLIINFPTKIHWRQPSEYAYIEEGLKELVRVIREKKIKSIAIPPLGAGNGGLNWLKVKELLVKYLDNEDCEIFIYEPSSDIIEVLRSEKVTLTPARAMLLSVLFDLVKNGEFVSEFAAEKIAYFLQRFGGKEVFKLEYKPNFYGPYSGKVKHVLHYLNGSYIMGYNAKDKKPFEAIGLALESEEDVNAFLQLKENASYLFVVEKTKKFLSGFYSPFALELLSTIDFLMQEKGIKQLDDISLELKNWSNRKQTLFNNTTFIQIALKHLQDNAIEMKNNK